MVLTLDGFDETEMTTLRAIWTEEPAMADINNSEDLLDVRDIIARVEELESLIDNAGGTFNAMPTDEERAEFVTLRALLSDLEGTGGDEQWRGYWYPVTMIRDSYFKEYAQQLADDIGAINSDATWPNNCIDWDKAARELRMDYTSVEFEGVTYWVR